MICSRGQAFTTLRSPSSCTEGAPMTSSPLPPAPTQSNSPGGTVPGSTVLGGTVPGQRRPDRSLQPDLGGPPWAPPTAAAGPAESYAHWWRRVVATLIDALLGVPFWAA